MGCNRSRGPRKATARSRVRAATSRRTSAPNSATKLRGITRCGRAANTRCWVNTGLEASLRNVELTLSRELIKAIDAIHDDQPNPR